MTFIRASVFPLCAQHTLRSLHISKIQCPFVHQLGLIAADMVVSKNTLVAELYKSTMVAARIVKRMIVTQATPNGIQRNQTATDTALQNH